jgi:glycosyltransferase involved in cell wall biosynthesis
VEQFFRERGDDVVTYISDFNHPEKKRRIDFSYHIHYQVIHVPGYKKNLSVGRLYSHNAFARRSYRQLCRESHVDLVYAMIPANSVAKFVKKYKSNHENTKVIFDVYDMWPESMQFGSGFKCRLMKVFLNYWRLLRDSNFDCADYVFLECGLYEKQLQKVLNKLPHQVMYATKRAMPCDVSPQLPEHLVSLCYMGSINHIIDIDTMVKFIQSLLTFCNVEFHVIGDGVNREDLLQKTRALGIQVHYHGRVYDEKEKKMIYAKCHFGLNFLKEGLCVGLTMKSVDYFEAGLPVINTVPQDTWALIEQYQAGINLDVNDICSAAECAAHMSTAKYMKLRENTEQLFHECFSSEMIERKLEQALNRCGV